MDTNKTSKINTETTTLKDYISLIRNNLFSISIITTACLFVSIIYAINATDIYRATATLKVSKPQGSILNAPLIPEFHDFGSDRFIANEIEIMRTFSTRERVAQALIDSFKTNNDHNMYYVLLDHKLDFTNKEKGILDVEDLAEVLKSVISIDQKRGLDIIEITAESPSPREAALIANCYSQQYRRLNLEVNRNHLTFVRNFLFEQKKEKQIQLNEAEELLRSFQERGGIIALDEQASSLISQLAQFEAKKNATQIELITSNKILTELKNELERQNPLLADYLQGLASEAYFQSLQEQLIKLEVNRDIAVASSNPNFDNNNVIINYETKIKEIQRKLSERIEVIKSGVFASSPAEVKELSQKIINEEVKNQSLKISIKELETIISQYESKFNRLPKTAIELARYQRNRESLEKLYTLVEEKFQEAVINEQSQPGNVLIIDNARRPALPSKPNRLLIIFVGFVLGFSLAFGFIFIRNYFDNTVKTPEDIQGLNVNVLAWIPQIEGVSYNGSKGFEFIVSKKPDSIPSEAFRALRTRVQFSKIDENSLKTILITSPAPQEGKTTVAINLAGSFAQAGKNTLILDCDLRKPRIHSLFGVNKQPGLIDHLFNKATLDQIIRKSEIDGLSFITSGTIPPNPAEMLGSQAMKDLLVKIKMLFDIIIIDSPPIIAVTDSEMLSASVDGTIVVVSAETTELDLLKKSVELLKSDKITLLGTVLNNFSYKSGYGSYYKYYYYYSQPGQTESEKKPIINFKHQKH